jgi:sugar phosphate isomerase/epimerase
MLPVPRPRPGPLAAGGGVLLKLAFSTAACPEWAWDEVIAKAVEFGFDGVEWRLTRGSPVPSDIPDDLAAEIAAATAAAGLGVPAMDSGHELPIAPEPGQEPGLAMIRRGLATARRLRAERLVVVPGPYPEAITDGQAAAWLRGGLQSLRDAVRETGVQLALDLRSTLTWDRARLRAKTCSAFVNEALWDLDQPGIGVQWDLAESYLEGERADQVWDNIWRWLSYLQLRDMERDESGWRDVAVGTGQLPVSFAIAYVGGSRYTGWTSLNWDRLANPGLAPAQEALPAFMRYARRFS